MTRLARHEIGDRLGVTGVDLDGAEPRVVEARDQGLRTLEVVVGDEPGLEEVPTGRDQGRGGSDATGADDEDSHAELLRMSRSRRSGAGWYLDVETIQ